MIYLVVVVYNTFCAESSTCRCLMEQHSEAARVIVYDNSTTDHGNRDFCSLHGWTYLTNGRNDGLSKAYNAVIENLPPHDGADCLCILDDDTMLPACFLSDMAQAMEQYPDVDIFLPILRQGDRILSPSRKGRTGRSGYYTTEEACLEAPTEVLAAFNSGMTIRLRVFDHYRYDERLFLDGVDHRFLEDMQERRKKVLPLVCTQQFSGGERPPKSAALTRFRIYARDSRVLYENSRASYWKIVGRRAVHLMLRYRDPVFLGILFQNNFKEGV